MNEDENTPASPAVEQEFPQVLLTVLQDAGDEWGQVKVALAAISLCGHPEEVYVALGDALGLTSADLQEPEPAEDAVRAEPPTLEKNSYLVMTAHSGLVRVPATFYLIEGGALSLYDEQRPYITYAPGEWSRIQREKTEGPAN